MDRCRFSGQQGFVADKIGRREKPEIGRHAAAGFDQDQITRHQEAAVDLLHVSVAHYGRLRLLQLAQRESRLAGRVLLHAAYYAVRDEDDCDEQSVAHIAERERYKRGGQQYINQRTAKLAQERCE